MKQPDLIDRLLARLPAPALVVIGIFSILLFLGALALVAIELAAFASLLALVLLAFVVLNFLL